MEVVVQDNAANKPMHNAPYVVGHLDAPDEHYIPHLYSHYKATKDFNALDKDIYEQTAKHKPVDRKKTPTSVFCIFGGSILFGLYKLIKHLIKK